MAPGARNKFGAPMLAPEVFRKQMYCIEESAYDIVVTFWPLAVIRRQGNCASLYPSLRPWWCAIKIGKFSENEQIFKSEVMSFYSINICNFRTQYGMDLAQTANKAYWRHFGFTRVVFVSFLCLPHPFFRRGLVCFANNKTFLTINKLLF